MFTQSYKNLLSLPHFFSKGNMTMFRTDSQIKTLKHHQCFDPNAPPQPKRATDSRGIEHPGSQRELQLLLSNFKSPFRSGGSPGLDTAVSRSASVHLAVLLQPLCRCSLGPRAPSLPAHSALSATPPFPVEAMQDKVSSPLPPRVLFYLNKSLKNKAQNSYKGQVLTLTGKIHHFQTVLWTLLSGLLYHRTHTFMTRLTTKLAFWFLTKKWFYCHQKQTVNFFLREKKRLWSLITLQHPNSDYMFFHYKEFYKLQQEWSMSILSAPDQQHGER